jgi:hypothetical protein
MKNTLLLLLALSCGLFVQQEEATSPVTPINYAQYNKFSNWQKRAEVGPVIFMFTADW